MRRYWLDPAAGLNVSQGNPVYNLYAPYGLNNMTGPEAKVQGIPVPVFLSLPYFFHADEYYVREVEFLPPYNGANHSRYNTELEIEPWTGITMSAKKRIQVNVKIEGTMLRLPNMPEYFFPIVWFDLESTIGDKLADKFKSQVYLGLSLKKHLPLIGGLEGGLLFVAAVTMMFYGFSRKDSSAETERLLPEQTNPTLN